MKLDNRTARKAINDLELIRMKRGLTQAEVCEQIGVDKTWIATRQNRSESGEFVSLKTIQRWADALDCELTISVEERPVFKKENNW